MFGLADCNNFYCSCERVFHPDLRERPVVVLSNNDGCVVALSQEAKAAGIKRGDVFFQIKDLLEAKEVAVFSSNYNLYGDMSRRVMSLLSQHTPHLDIYSIDEAFLDFSGMDALWERGQSIVRSVRKGTGIPISMGIAPTKTLAKMASKFAKQYKGYNGCCVIDTDEKREKALRLFDVSDVWGIGWQFSKLMKSVGVETAWDFTQKSEAWVRSKMKTPGVRTWKELRGESCISIDELPHKLSIRTSRSFPEKGLSQLDDLLAAVSNFAAIGARKLRLQHTASGSITIWASTSRFNHSTPGNTIYGTYHFPVATNDLQEIVAAAVQLIRQNWVKGDYWYKNAGVLLWNIVRTNEVQGNLFDEKDRAKMARLMEAVDAINRKNGHNTIRLAVQGFDSQWAMKQEYKSRQYTTNLNDVIVLKVR